MSPRRAGPWEERWLCCAFLGWVVLLALGLGVVRELDPPWTARMRGGLAVRVLLGQTFFPLGALLAPW